MKPRTVAILALCVVSAIWLPALSSAQTAELRVHVRSPTGAALAGALVALIGSEEQVAAEGLSNAQGLRVLRAPEGVYRIRIRRIGFQPFFSDGLPLLGDGDINVVVQDQRFSDYRRESGRALPAARGRRLDAWNRLG